jgi:hypothetical protein
MAQRDVFIKSGSWRTLETRWSSTKINYFFRNPSGAKIRVRYGYGWFSKNRQKQTLDGSVKTILVGSWGLTRAKIQIKVNVESIVVYEVVPIGPQV